MWGLDMNWRWGWGTLGWDDVAMFLVILEFVIIFLLFNQWRRRDGGE